jgi:hypothetical protein
LREKEQQLFRSKGNNRRTRKELQFHEKEYKLFRSKGKNKRMRKEQHHHEHVKDRVHVIKQNESMEHKKVLIVVICPDSSFLDEFL